MRNKARKLRVIIAAAAFGGVSTCWSAQAATPAAIRYEPIRLHAAPGWLDGEADDSAPAHADTSKADDGGDAPTADRAAPASRDAIVAAARAALAARVGYSPFARTPEHDVRVHATGYGPYVAQFAQRVDGLEVYGARVNVLLDRGLEVRAIAGGAVDGADDSARPAFVRDEATSLRSAAIAVDGLLAASRLSPLSRHGQGVSYFRFERSPTFVPTRPATIRRIWYPGAQGLMPAYHAQIIGRQPGVERPLARAVIVSADDGRLLSSTDLVHDAEPFDYRVFADPSGRPYVDPYGFTNPYPTRLPSGYLPSTPAPMNRIAARHAGISTGDPWLADAAVETSGNNVDAFFNADPVDADGYCAYDESDDFVVFKPEQGDFRAHTSGPRAFDYAFDAGDTRNDFVQCDREGLAHPIPTASAQLNAKIVQAFYATNWLHDYFYDLGFDEDAGNMQVDNYGRGGVGDDPLHVSAGYYTTFAFVSEDDGGLAGLVLGVNARSASQRDVSAFDFGVLAHEWSHTMFGRLTRMAYGGQQGALNEGIADFVGLILSVRAQDRYALAGKPPFYANYAIGAYMNRDYDFPVDPYPPAGSPSYPDDTYYHGIRRFPHSVDLAINPLTFEYIGMDHPLPDAWHAYDWKARVLTNAEIHTAGEVWTEALWQCSRALIAAQPSSRFEQTRARFLSNMVASLKLVPADADYLEARDALLAVIRADSEADYLRCRAGFAERGMGAGAIAPDRYSIDLRGVTESFDDRERALSIVDVKVEEVAGGDGDGVLDRGETGRLSVTVKNSGFSPLDRVRVRVQAPASRYVFPNGRELTGIRLDPGASTVVTFDVRVQSRAAAAELPLTVFARDVRWIAASDRKEAAFRVNYDLVRDSGVDSLAAEQTFVADWTSALGESDVPDYCYVSCATHWHRIDYAGVPAYVIGDAHALVDAHLSSVAFPVSSTAPLRIRVRHDYDFDRLPTDSGSPGVGLLELSIDGGDWGAIDSHSASGPTQFTGRSSGWRDDVVDFGTSLAGHRVQFRWHATIDSGYFEHFAHWAIARVEVQGAAEPPFSSLHADVN